MKRLFTLLLVAVLITGAYSQAPEKMSYQAVIRNASGELVKSSSVGMKISIFPNYVTAPAVYVETHTSTTNVNGLVTLEIGGGTVVSGTFAGIDWSTGVYLIKTEIDPTGGTNYSISGTSQLFSVPYALYSKTSENIKGVTVSFTGDTLYFGTNKIIIPGLSAANQLKDIDGNIYKTVKIGNQVWMAENLKTTKYANGESITGSFAYNNDNNNVAVYGRLYTWNAVVDNRNICPTGWHTPNLAEWNGLVNYAAIPDRLKESGTSHWLSPNTGATNSVLFTALPGGVSTGGGFFGLGQIGGFWLTREIDPTNGLGFLLYYNNNPTTGDYVYRSKSWGHSVRCVKD
jgi:uncharacterized protein (TIGR02145 family)